MGFLIRYCLLVYAATKSAAEQFVHAFRHSFGINAVIIRGNNGIGPGEIFITIVLVAVCICILFGVLELHL